MKKHLSYKDNKSDKFWQIEVTGNTYTVTYGKTGSKGSSKTKEFASDEAALKDAQKQINAKLKKGYQDASTNNSPNQQATKSSKASAKTTKSAKAVPQSKTFGSLTVDLNDPKAIKKAANKIIDVLENFDEDADSNGDEMRFLFDAQYLFDHITKDHPKLTEDFVDVLFKKGPIYYAGCDVIGINAVAQLACHDIKHVSTFHSFLSTTDMNHEVNQEEYIDEVLGNWDWKGDVLDLAYARFSDLGGQRGIDQIEGYLCAMDDKTYNAFLAKVVEKNFHFDSIKKGSKVDAERHFYFIENLLSAMPTKGQEISTETLVQRFSDAISYHIVPTKADLLKENPEIKKAKKEYERNLLNKGGALKKLFLPESKGGYKSFFLQVKGTTCEYGAKKDKLKSKTFDTKEECKAFAQKQIDTKFKKGYLQATTTKDLERFYTALKKDKIKIAKQIIDQGLLFSEWEYGSFISKIIYSKQIEVATHLIDKYFEEETREHIGDISEWKLVYKICNAGEDTIKNDMLYHLAQKDYPLSEKDAETCLSVMNPKTAKALLTPRNRSKLNTFALLKEAVGRRAYKDEDSTDNVPNIPLLEYLMDTGIDLNNFPLDHEGHDSNKDPILHQLVRKDFPLEVIQKAIDCGADPTLPYIGWELDYNVKNPCKKGESAFPLLLSYAKKKAVKDCLQKAKKAWEEKKNHPPQILSSIDSLNQYLQNGGDPNYTDEHGLSLLHYAATKYPDAHLVSRYSGLRDEHKGYYIEDYPSELVETLLKSGANPNAEDPNGRTPLFYLQSYGAKHLVEHGADLYHQDKDGNTPLFFHLYNNVCHPTTHYPFYYNKSNRLQKAMIYQLIMVGFDVNYQDAEGKTILHHINKLYSPQNLAMYIIKKHNANLDIQDKDGNTCIAELQQVWNLFANIADAPYFDLEKVEEDGNTVLHKLSLYSNGIFVNELLKMGGNPMLANKAGKTVKDIFVANGWDTEIIDSVAAQETIPKSWKAIDLTINEDSFKTSVKDFKVVGSFPAYYLDKYYPFDKLDISAEHILLREKDQNHTSFISAKTGKYVHREVARRSRYGAEVFKDKVFNWGYVKKLGGKENLFSVDHKVSTYNFADPYVFYLGDKIVMAVNIDTLEEVWRKKFKALESDHRWHNGIVDNEHLIVRAKQSKDKEFLLKALDIHTGKINKDFEFSEELLDHFLRPEPKLDHIFGKRMEEYLRSWHYDISESYFLDTGVFAFLYHRPKEDETDRGIYQLFADKAPVKIEGTDDVAYLRMVYSKDCLYFSKYNDTHIYEYNTRSQETRKINLLNQIRSIKLINGTLLVLQDMPKELEARVLAIQ